jgi:hypothetical protein
VPTALHQGGALALPTATPSRPDERGHRVQVRELSAALRDLGYPHVDRYKPYSNYQALLLQVVPDQLKARPDLITLIASDLPRPATLPSVDDILTVVIDPPEPSGTSPAIGTRTDGLA